METKEDRWFVRFRGHTLGPLTTDQVKISLRKKELGASDRIASARNPSWCELSSVREFRELIEGHQRPEPPLVAPPSPQVLWKKKKNALAQNAALTQVAAALPPRPPEESFRKSAPSPAPAPKASPAMESTAPPAPEPQSSPRPGREKATSGPKRKAKRKKASSRSAKAPRLEEPKEKAKAVEEKKPASPGLVPPAAEALPAVEAPPANELVAETQPALAPFQEKTLPAPEPLPEPDSLPDPALARETLSLLGSLREWSRRERELMLEEVLPPRPRIEVRLPDPPAPEPRSRKLELHLTVSRPFLLLALALIAAAALFLAWPGTKKMRDLENFRLPDPSSPTIQPSAEDDPIPSLKAPTRPKRE